MDTTNIQVGIRIRPRIRREIQSGQDCLWHADKKKIYSTEKEYYFDEVFDSSSSTKSIYDVLGKPLVENAMRGINGTLFAYGQTASGKTHTILGDTNELGILPLAIKDVFDHTVKQPDREFLLRASFIEIYNEEMTDLLANKKESIKILTNSENDVVVENLTTHTVISYESTMELVHKGIINRKVGITNMNERSSRSHLIFRLVIESRQSSELNISMETNGTIIAAELNVVDLAGSERAGQTGAQGIRLKESSFINTSLMSLGVVIRKLSEGDKSCHIPYRDSKLTRLLQKSLGGNARTCIICAISPVVLEETQQTLLFASQAKEVKNRPTVNEVLDDKSMMRKQMTEINLLKKKIIDLETGISHLEKNKILAEQSSYQQKIEEQRERIAILLKEIVCTGRRSVQNVVKKDNMRRLTWCPGGLLRGREVSNEDKFLSEDVEMDALDGSFEKLEFQLLKQEFEEYKAQTCSPSEYKELKEKLTALEIQYETTKNKLRDMIISQEPHEVVQTLREENSKMNEKNVALSNEIVRLQAEISSKDGKISSLIDDVASLQEQQENMVDLDFLERLKEDVNAKSLELEESRRKCELENEELVHALSDQKKLWNEQVLCLEEQKFNLEQALLEANKKITQDCKNCENFQRELVLLHEKINSLNEEKNHVQVDIDKLIQENKELKSNISHFTAHGEELAKKQLSDFDMNAKLLELEEFRKKSDLKNEELVHALADQKKLWDEQVLNLEEQKFNLEQALLEANKILHDCKNCKSFQDQLVQSAQQIDSLCEEKKFDLSKIEFLIQENEGLKLKVDQLSCIEEEPIQKVLSSELELLRQQIAFINEEKNLAVSKVEMLVQENEGLKLKVNQLCCIEEELIQKTSSGELELLRQQIAFINEEKNLAVSKVEMLVQENEGLKLKVNQLSCIEEELIQKNSSGELELLRQQIAFINEEKNLAVSKVEMLVLENEGLKLKVNQLSCIEEELIQKNSSGELELLRQQISFINEEKNLAVSKVEMLVQENEGLKLKVNQLSCIEEELIQKTSSGELELLRQQIASINEEKNILLSKIEMLVQENEVLKLKVNQLSCIEEELIQKNSSGELELLRQQIAFINEEKNLAVSKVEMLVQENEGLKLKVDQLSCIEEELIQKNSSGELELLRQQIAFINEEKNLAVSKVEMLVQENEGLKLKVDQLSCIEEELIQKNSSGELELLRQQIAFINEEKNLAVSKIEMLVQENEGLKLKVNQLCCIEEEFIQKNSSGELELLRQQIASINEEKNILLSKVEMLVQENEGLKLKVNQLSCIEEEFIQKNSSGELELLRQQISFINEEKNLAVSKIEMLVQENEGLKLKVNQLSCIEEELIQKNCPGELELLRQQIAFINEEKNIAVSKVEMLVQQNEELKLKVNQLTCIEEELKEKSSPSELELLRQQIAVLNEEKNIATSKIEILVQENEGLKLKDDQFSCIDEEFQKIKLEELELLRQQINSLNEEKVFALSKIDMLIQENERLKSKVDQFSTIEESLIKKNSDELELLRKHVDSLCKDKNFALSKVDMLIQKNEELKSKVDQFKMIRKKFQKENSNELDLLKQQIDSLCGEKNSTLSKMEMLVQENEGLKLKVDQLNSIKEEITKKYSPDKLELLRQEISSVNGEKNIALSKIEMLVQENERLKSEVDQLSSIKDEFQKKSSDVELLRQQMNSHYEEKNFVLSKMDSLIQENNQLKATVEEFEFEETFVKKRLTDELDLLRQQINSLYEEKNFALSKIDTITQENKGLKSKVDKLKSEKKLAMENLKGELKILREQVESLHEEKNMTQLKIDTLTQENEQLKSKLNQFNTVEEELARKKLLDLKKSLVEEVSELKKRICKLTEVNQELLELKNEAFNEKKHLSDEVDLLNKKLSEIENDLKLSYSKNSDLIEALKKEQEDCAKKCKLSQIAYERRSGQLEAESEVLIQNLKTLQVENVQITEINKELKAEILELKKNFERKESENIIVLNEKEKLVKELKENITSLDEKLQTYDKVLLNNEDLMQRVNNLEETKLVLEQSLKKTNKEFQEMLRNQKKIEPYQAQQFQLASEKENQVLHQINNQPHITSMFENLTKQDLIEKIVHLEHHLELRKKDIAVYSDHRIEQNAKIDQLKKKNEEYVSQLKRLNQILTDCRKPSGNASTLEWEEHSISLERAKVKLESQVSYLEERKRVLKLHLDRFQQENIHLNVLLNQSDKKFEIASKESADIIKCVKEEKDKLAEEIQNLRHDNERITTGLKEAFNRMNLAENALKETKSVAESEISKRDTEIEKLSSYLLRSFERYQHYKGIAKNCLEEKCSSKSKSVKNLSVLQDATTMTENCSPNPSESNKRKSTELSEGERPKSKKKLSSSVKDGGDEAECNQQ